MADTKMPNKKYGNRGNTASLEGVQDSHKFVFLVVPGGNLCL